MVIGTVKWFNATKGFGFIDPENGGSDLFVHISAVEKSGMRGLNIGQRVAFSIQNDPRKGKSAAVDLQAAPLYDEADLLHDIETEEIHSLPDTVRAIGLDDILNSEYTTDTVEVGKEYNDFMINSVQPIIRLLRDVNNDNKLIHCLSSEEFEYFSLGLLAKEGFDAKLISSWNQADGGIDIFAVSRHISGIKIQVAVQCKRTNGKIQADPIRALNGVIDSDRIHCGIIMTTGIFTKECMEEAERKFWKINLRDYKNLLSSLRRIDLVE